MSDEDDELPRIVRLLMNHRQELYEKVKTNRAHSNRGTYRYPERLRWDEQAHPDHLGPEYEFARRFDRNVEKGFGVITQVEWLSSVEEIEMQPKEMNAYGDLVDPEWFKTLTSSPGLVPENPLLAITVRPSPGHAFPYARFRTPGEPFHASVAFYWDLGPNIYDRNNLMEHLINKFHHKFHLLQHDPKDSGIQKWTDETTGEVQEGHATVMHLDKKRDPIASDIWLNLAKQRSRYHARDWHISL